MIRLPATGIDVSQSDLQNQLQQLDFYSGLLKQGFRKQDIIRYLRERDADSNLPPDRAPSTFELLSRSSDSDRSEGTALAHQTPEVYDAQFASPIKLPEEDAGSPNDESDGGSVTLDIAAVTVKKTYAPRQSSLLRFARAVSSEASDEGNKVNASFSPRAITYRPRSQTYSYDQSELDEEDHTTRYSTPDKLGLEHLSLQDDIVTSTESTKTVQIASNLRPDAEPFTPSQNRLVTMPQALEDADDCSNPSSSSPSIPSSPPEVSQSPSGSGRGSPSLPPMPYTPLRIRTVEAPSTVQTRSQQFLDGSFTVYNDSVPARLQPQTPAELSRGQYLSQYNAAFTAPPGMVRSSAARHGINTVRQASGELSPTAQAIMIRERRQREFRRGLHVEGLRIDRSQANTRQPRAGPSTDVDPFNIWRDDLDADGVGEENFEEVALEPMLRRMRVFSGNRRAG